LPEDFEEQHAVAIIGNEPEALLLSVLHAEAGISNYLVGQFRDWDQAHEHRSGIEEALWLFHVHRRAGRILHETDTAKLPFSRTKTLMIASSPGNARDTDSLEKTLRNIAPQLSVGTQIAFVGLCKPHFTSDVIKSAIEKHGGMKVGQDIGLSYIPMHWTGEPVSELREHPIIIATFGDRMSDEFQEQILRIFPSLIKTNQPENAEAAGLFSALSREVTHALTLDLAKASKTFGLGFEEIANLCSKLGRSFPEDNYTLTGRESIGATIALNGVTRREGSRLIRAAHRVNEDYQSQIMEMVKGAVDLCGQRLRRSRITVLGTEGLVRNSWARREPPTLIHALQRKGADVTLYPGQVGIESWAKILDGSGRVETNLWKAVSKATCTVVALPREAALELDAVQLAHAMNRPGAICDLSRVLEASNVERAGLFYTSIGRGSPIS
jgi:UDP-N-acetyl-D-mannosaminuronate dehydrogenase